MTGTGVEVGEQRAHVTEDDRSLGELFGDLSRDFSTLMRQEVELAKTEIREEATKAGKAGGMLGGAAAAGYFCLLLASFALAWGLAELIPTGFAFLVVALLYGITAAALFVMGRSRLREVRPVPDDTVETLKEDVQWARAQLK
jgi:hypothetical protein